MATLGLADYQYFKDIDVHRFLIDDSRTRTRRWSVAFGKKSFQCQCLGPSRSGLCRHIDFVADFIAQNAGPWEQHGDLMSEAWAICLMQKETRTGKMEPVWSKDLRVDPDKSKDIVINLDAAKYAKMVFDESKEWEFDPEIIRALTESMKRDIDGRISSAFIGTDTASGPDKTAYTWNETTQAKPKKKKHQDPPEEPKKPKSRFSEIDL